MTVRQFESTFDNAVSGLFGIGDFSLASWNSLKVSLYYQKDHVRIQDDVNLPWDEFDQGTFSAGIEDHVSLHSTIWTRSRVRTRRASIPWSG